MDKRYQKTEEKLSQSLITLLNDYSLYEISITKLCRHANIQRNTFYDHYDNICDLLEHIVSSYEFDALKIISSTASDKNFNGMITNTINTIYLDKNLQKLLKIPSFSNAYLLRISNKCNKLVTKSFPIKLNIDKDKYICANRYATGGTILLIYDWINSGLKESPTSIIQKIVEFAQNTLEVYLK